MSGATRHNKSPRDVARHRVHMAALFAFVIGVATSVLFVWIAKEVHENETIALDHRVLVAVRGLSTPWLDHVMVFLTQFGGVITVPVATIGLAVYFWQQHGWKQAAILIVGVGGSSVLNLLLKSIFSRARPDVWQQLVSEQTFSFPSGHAMASASLAASLVVILWYTRWRKAAIILGVLYVFVIGFSRLYLGVHYPTDIVAGWAASVAWVAAVAIVFSRYDKYSG